MGNSIGGRKKAKVMKLNGETLKLKTPVRAWDVLKDYPGQVLLDSIDVKNFGVKAKPLGPQDELKPRKVYFLVDLPKIPEEKAPRRINSGINMSAKDRLECLMLSRRAMSDMTMVRPSSSTSLLLDGRGQSPGPAQVKMRIPRAQLAKFMEESRDGVEVAEKIFDLYVMKNDNKGPSEIGRVNSMVDGRVHSMPRNNKKRVSFHPIEGEIHTYLDAVSRS